MLGFFERRRRSIFDVFDEILREFEREMADIEDEFERLAKEKPRGALGPYYYGVRITIGPDGVPKVEEFGNIKRVGGRPIVTEEAEPLVDVIDQDDEIIVVAELPGVDKNKIKVRATEEKLIINAENHRKYHKVIDLPAKINPNTAKASYRNGVLEVKLKKEGRKEEGVDVKLE